MKQILIDNALESWKSAISYANDIVNGMATLEYRKNFVASLHNAVELFIKQRMLDVGDHDVCKKISKKRDPNGNLQAVYDATTDLNNFFSCLSQSDAEKYRSEDYHVICNKTIDLFSTYYATHPQDQTVVLDALTVLGDLRNNETHFFIDKWTFLTEVEFAQLYNFMIVFYRILQEYQLLPFQGEPVGEYKKLAFERTELKSFSYEDALLSSSILRIIASTSNGVPLPCVDNSAFSVAKEIMDYFGPTYWKDKFDELWAQVETAMHYGLLEVDDIIEEFDEPGIGKGANACRYIIVHYR